ncbi:hypothetical protein JTB14_033587 [Gonioctena quinquepunctata]|nr:hypothetical protein JTB14_033587 [Gonioctena quinquepunctata]
MCMRIKTQNVQPKSQDTQKITDRQVSEAIQIAQSTIIAQDKNRNRNTRQNHWDKSKYGAIVGSNIKTVPKKGYVPVPRIATDIKYNDLLRILKKNAPNITFACDDWKRNEHMSTYKVTFSMEHINQVYDPFIWPPGAVIQRFKFKENFQKMVQTETNL